MPDEREAQNGAEQEMGGEDAVRGHGGSETKPVLAEYAGRR
ncbi:MAG: hypothetical protein U0W40_11080 [Acidimicrobiia bacterium]